MSRVLGSKQVNIHNGVGELVVLEPTCELPRAGGLVGLGGGDVGAQQLRREQLLTVLPGGSAPLLVHVQHMRGQPSILHRH